MADDYEPTPEEIAAYVERMLVSLEVIAAAAPTLGGLMAQLRLARLTAAQHRARGGAGGSLPPAEVAAAIADELESLATRSEQSGLAMLAYLIGIAREEAEARTRHTAA